MLDVKSTIRGVEYNELPLPHKLYKAMESQYAEMFVQGVIRIFPFSFYKDREHLNEEVGDVTEGIGIIVVNGVSCQIESANPVFILCASVIGA